MSLKNLWPILVVIGTLGSVIAFFEYIKRFFSGCSRWLSQPMGSRRPPRRINFAITPDYSQCHWQEGGRGGVEHMLVICGLNVTNTGPANLGQVVDVYIRHPHTRARNYMDPDVFYPNGLARVVVFNFEVAPVVVQSGENFVADVVLVDQFGGEHLAEGVTFTPSGAHVWGQNGARV